MFRLWRDIVSTQRCKMQLWPGLHCTSDPAGGAYKQRFPIQSSPDPVADFKRAASQYARNGHNFTTIQCNIWLQGRRGGKGKGRKGEGKGRRAAGGEREETWNRAAAADWLRPALLK